MGSSTCMFTLSENTSPLKEFIISNSLNALTVGGRNYLGIRLGVHKKRGDERSLVPTCVSGI